MGHVPTKQIFTEGALTDVCKPSALKDGERSSLDGLIGVIVSIFVE